MTDLGEPVEYSVLLDVRNLQSKIVTVSWQEGKEWKELDLEPESQNFISIVMVKKFYPDPIKLKAFQKKTKKIIELRGRKELDVMLQKKTFTEVIKIGRYEYKL